MRTCVVIVTSGRREHDGLTRSFGISRLLKLDAESGSFEMIRGPLCRLRGIRVVLWIGTHRWNPEPINQALYGLFFVLLKPIDDLLRGHVHAPLLVDSKQHRQKRTRRPREDGGIMNQISTLEESSVSHHH
jgi:hypothetical protein